MKFIPFVFLLIFVSCAHIPKNDVVQHMENQFEPETVSESPKTLSVYQIELNNAFDNVAIDAYYKEIYKKEKLVITDDDKMLTITQNLFIKETDKDLFYFIVFTKSMNESDGFYSEALGLSAMNFVTENTAVFAEFFSCGVTKLNDKDLDNWVKCIRGEIQISNEGNEANALEELEQILNKNVQASTSEQKTVIELFLKKLNN